MPDTNPETMKAAQETFGGEWEKVTQITKKQNSAIHVAFRQWAKELNDAGYDITTAVKQDKIKLPVPFTEQNVKDLFGRVYLHALYPDKTSFTELTTVETQLVFDAINAGLAKVFGVSIEFPNNRYGK